MQGTAERRAELEQILREHTRKAERVEQLENRLYAIDGRIYTLEDLTAPRAGERAELAALKQAREEAEGKKARLSAEIEAEDALILRLIERIENRTNAEALRLLYVEMLSPEAAAAKIYGHSSHTARQINALYKLRARGLAELAELRPEPDRLKDRG